MSKLSRLQIVTSLCLSLSLSGCGEPKKPKIGPDDGSAYTLEKREKVEQKIGVALPALTTVTMTSIWQVERLLKIALNKPNGLLVACQKSQTDISNEGKTLEYSISNEACPPLSVNSSDRFGSWEGQEKFTVTYEKPYTAKDSLPKTIEKKADAKNNITLRSERKSNRGRNVLTQTILIYDDIKLEQVKDQPGVYQFTYGHNSNDARANLEMRTEILFEHGPEEKTKNKNGKDETPSQGSGLMASEELQRIRAEREKMRTGTAVPAQPEQQRTNNERFSHLRRQPTTALIQIYASGFVNTATNGGPWEWSIIEAKLRWTQKSGQELITDTFMNLRPQTNQATILNKCSIPMGTFLTAENISFLDVKKEATYDDIFVLSDSDGKITVSGDPKIISLNKCETTGFYGLNEIFGTIDQNLRGSPIYLGRSRPKPQPAHSTPQNKGSVRLDNGKKTDDSSKDSKKNGSPSAKK